jgi:hypothetical protein
MKQRVFIGSSSEGLAVANFLKAQLEPDVDCRIWNDDIFKYNHSFFHTLIREASLFDYGILIATKDDFVDSRDNIFEAARDNVIFEFGLFLGAMGPEKAFIVQEKDCKLPSDLLGITIPSFERTPDLINSDGLTEFITLIKKTIEENSELGTLSMLPSTALAIGYFNNFIKPLSEQLFVSEKININEKDFTESEVVIVIPSELDSDIKKYAQVFFKTNGLDKTSVQTAGRDFPVYVSYDSKNETKFTIYDVPTTLDGVDKAIEMVLQKGHVGKSSQQVLLEERELRNFETTLRSLISADAYAREIVRVQKY